MPVVVDEDCSVPVVVDEDCSVPVVCDEDEDWCLPQLLLVSALPPMLKKPKLTPPFTPPPTEVSVLDPCSWPTVDSVLEDCPSVFSVLEDCPSVFSVLDDCPSVYSVLELCPCVVSDPLMRDCTIPVPATSVTLVDHPSVCSNPAARAMPLVKEIVCEAATPALVAMTSHSPMTTILREKHVAAPGADQLPTPQRTHVEAPASEYVPAAGHSWHVSGKEAPWVGEDVPGEQGVLSELPPSQKWPTGQVTPDADVDPGGQEEPRDAEQDRQEEAAEPAAYVPASHREHVEAPSDGEKAPGEQELLFPPMQ